MILNLKIIYHDYDSSKVLCFTHAVKAVKKGHRVVPEVDEFGGGNDMRIRHCQEEDCPD